MVRETERKHKKKTLKHVLQQKMTPLGLKTKDLVLVINRDESADINMYKSPSRSIRPDSKETNVGPPSDSRMNSRLSNVSSDPESALSVPPAPKTVREWLTDPHLYKVTCFIPRVQSGQLNCSP